MISNYKRAKVDGRVTTVMDLKEVLGNPYFQNKFTSVQIKDVVLPVKTSYDPTSAGLYISNNSKVGRIVYPNENDKEEYSSKNIIDFSNVQNMKELIEKQEEVKKLESEVLSNSDNLFKPIPKENDFPEMKALKQAICLKNIDIDAYTDRFGDNFNNDKRLLKGSSITMSKMKSICNKLDLKVTLTISDASPNVVNPMNDVISVDICGDANNNEEDE